MNPSLFDQLETTLRSEGASAAIERLCSSLRESGDYHLLFYALLLKKRHELGVHPVPTGPASALPAESQEPYEEGIRAAAREVGHALLQRGEILSAWSYFRIIDEPEPVRAALAAYQPEESDTLQGMIQLAVYEGLDPQRGFEWILQHYGTCNAITTLSGSEQFTEEQRRFCIRALVRTLYHDLRSNLTRLITEQEGTTPPEAEAPRDTPGVLLKLIDRRDWLFADDAYHIDTSHLSSVVQMSMQLMPGLELDLARVYGSKLSGRFLAQDDEPFERGYSDYRVYLDILAGQEVEQGLAYFRSKLESANPEEIGTYPAEVLVNLYLKLGRGREAIAIARKYLSDTGGRPLSCPNLNELCQKTGEYGLLAETAREQGDPVHYLAGLLAAKE
ncbi:MAG: hypothetical protein SNJ82_04220 [Gemmataceae bacterium]